VSAPGTTLNPDDPNSPSFLKMVGFVAVSVALTILIFFGIGYVLGRVFL
jgi:preprotein translocase subunit SecE